MAKQPDDDLFANTTMTFGEHLEELRVSLGKALMGLMVGFLAGLCVANHVVAYIQTPLKKALENHYVDKAVAEFKGEYENVGEELSKDVEDFITKKRFVYEKVYVEAGEITRVKDLVKQHETQPAEPSDESGPATEPESGPATEPEPGPATEPEAGPATEPEENPEPESASDPGPKDLAILGEDIPPPQPVLVATRVWRPIDTVVKALSAQEAFMIWLKAAFVAGMVLASPYIFWQLWDFVAAGLYPHEKKYVHIYLPFSMVLFLSGVAMAFFVVFQYVLGFLFSFNRAMNIDPDPRISEWLGFVLFLPLGFGVAFQLPLVMLFLHRIGMFSIKAYLDKWRIAILVIFVLSMLLTPADPISMLLMALPMTLLYFLGIGLCKWMPRNKSAFSEAYEP